jgi:hypothetical protein
LDRQLDQVDAGGVRRIDVVPDHWSLQHQAAVPASLRQVPRLEPVWPPTSAP